MAVNGIVGSGGVAREVWAPGWKRPGRPRVWLLASLVDRRLPGRGRLHEGTSWPTRWWSARMMFTGSVSSRVLLEDGHQADHTLLVVLRTWRVEHVFSAIFIAGKF